ncbi:MAG TPA: DUF1232 domain-containing protein [Burkholderiaceae bacterium]|nr:DUF1232 domain-containing protein [Burkholderiaceae bacterium]
MWKLGALWWKFKKEIMMVFAMLKNPASPAIAKLVAILAAVYIVSPIDLVPDIIPILGWLDDGIIAIILFKIAFKLLPKDLYDSLKAQFEKKGGKVNDADFAKPVAPKAKIDDVVVDAKVKY